MIARVRQRAAGGRGRAVRAVSVLMCVALLVASCGGEVAPRAVVAVGAPAPSYAAEKADGTPIALADLKGEVVLLNIWATWCKPCRQEIPALETLHQRHGAAGLVVAGVSIDVDEDRGKVAEYAGALGASYAIWYDPDDRVSTTFLALGVPASYLIGRDGTLRWRHVGPITAEDGALNAALMAALGEPAPGAEAANRATPRN
ncbi:MAG: TlpA family protein disulfide reductase [Gemmatimonadetes bacterium]|nr:TlpA family protein disulfide reductase [Gemmatimonadota bacterium]